MHRLADTVQHPINPYEGSRVKLLNTADIAPPIRSAP